MDYAIARQRDRRNLSREQLTSYIARVVRSKDRPMPHGGDRRSIDFKAPMGALKPSKSADELGTQIGVSGRTVERIRAVFASDDEEAKEQLLAGEIAPRAAYEQVKETERVRADSAPLRGC